MSAREDLAREYGFETYAALRAASIVLPRDAEDAGPSYMAKVPDGHWFLWRDPDDASPAQRRRGSRSE